MGKSEQFSETPQLTAAGVDALARSAKHAIDTALENLQRRLALAEERADMWAASADRLQNLLNAAYVDADRYRWLRQCKPEEFPVAPDTPEELDAVIDAALVAAQEQEG